MSQIHDIFQGWGRSIQAKFQSLPEDVQKRSELRMSICDSCHMRSNKVCSPRREGTHVTTGEKKKGCGCALLQKTLADNSRCPLGKWEFAFRAIQKVHEIEQKFAAGK